MYLLHWWRRQVAVADFDADGHLDIVVCNWDGPARLWHQVCSPIDTTRHPTPVTQAVRQPAPVTQAASCQLQSVTQVSHSPSWSLTDPTHLRQQTGSQLVSQVR